MSFEWFAHLGLKRDIPSLAWPRPGDRILNLGAGQQELPWTHERLDYPHWNGEEDFLPQARGSIDVVFAFHFLEHLSSKGVINVLREVERVLRPGGVFNIVVPHGAVKLAYEDLDHKTRFNEDTWRNLFRTDYYAKHGEWRLAPRFNVLFGLTFDNLCLFTQLERTP